MGMSPQRSSFHDANIFFEIYEKEDKSAYQCFLLAFLDNSVTFKPQFYKFIIKKNQYRRNLNKTEHRFSFATNSEPIALILEFAKHGDLLDVIKSYRKQQKSEKR